MGQHHALMRRDELLKEYRPAHLMSAGLDSQQALALVGQPGTEVPQKTQVQDCSGLNGLSRSRGHNGARLRSERMSLVKEPGSYRNLYSPHGQSLVPNKRQIKQQPTL